MAERALVESVASDIIAEIVREFPALTLELDFDTAREEHQDAYIWISAPGADDEQINEIWGYVIQMVQGAYQERDVYLVARMRGVEIIDRRGRAEVD